MGVHYIVFVGLLMPVNRPLVEAATSQARRNATIIAPMFHRRMSAAQPSSDERAAWEAQKHVLGDENAVLHRLRGERFRIENEAQSLLRQGAYEIQRRAGICVVGQAARLEVASKVNHVLIPNTLYYTIDVILAVSPSGTAHFANNFTDTGARMAWQPEDMRAQLEPFLAGGKLIIDVSAQDEAPFLRRHYVSQGDRFMKQEVARREERTRSHVRQWWSLWRCHKHFVHMERENKFRYDVLVKMRDDSFFVDHLDINAQKLQLDEALFRRCNRHYGLNDKVALMHGSVEYKFFARHILDWYDDAAFEKLALGVLLKNPEGYTKAVMRAHAVKVRTVMPEAMPALTCRIVNNQGKVCIPPSKIGVMRDCVPNNFSVRRAVASMLCDQKPRAERMQRRE
mmetsp:Transcript_4820/g.14202  ORF Transcript_4820/g.14202 Transcript_4820/m.14202 type:complete len:397 (-) Transcript_4820:404-1594(-)